MVTNDKTLVIITRTYPYDKGESFVKNELESYNSFKKVYIVPINTIQNYDSLRPIPDNTQILTINKIGPMYKSILVKILETIKNLFSPIVLNELVYTMRRNKLSLKVINTLLRFTYEGNHKTNQVKKSLDNAGIKKSEDIIFYSYWMHTAAFIGQRLSKKYYKNSKFISRCHGYDLYEERNPLNYLPYRKLILESCDTVFAISNEGKAYIENKYNDLKKNIEIARLGTLSYANDVTLKKENQLVIVSCSFINPVKRVHRIVSSLSMVDKVKVKWVHFGDGELADDMKKKSAELLDNKENIDYEFKGFVDNEQLMKFYQNNKVHLFINVSSSEGVPVSIMEAMSFGIPVIATDVGGVAELVIHDKCGILLKSEFEDDDIVKSIIRISDMSDSDYDTIRKNCRQHWQENYSAQKNYSEFANKIMEL